MKWICTFAHSTRKPQKKERARKRTSWNECVWLFIHFTPLSFLYLLFVVNQHEKMFIFRIEKVFISLSFFVHIYIFIIVVYHHHQQHWPSECEFHALAASSINVYFAINSSLSLFVNKDEWIPLSDEFRAFFSREILIVSNKLVSFEIASWANYISAIFLV